jgi:hypothetical protein
MEQPGGLTRDGCFHLYATTLTAVVRPLTATCTAVALLRTGARHTCSNKLQWDRGLNRSPWVTIFISGPFLEGGPL